MPEPITQPESWRKLIDSPQRPAGVPPREPPPVNVHVTRISLSFNDVFALVFMVVIAQVVIGAMIGIVVVGLLLLTGNL